MTMTAPVSISGQPFDPETAIARARQLVGKELSAERLERYRWLLGRYPERMAIILPVLRLVEEEWGVIDQDGMRYVAALLDCPPSQVMGVVSFYTHFHTEGCGRFVLDVCMTLPCATRGAGKLLEHLERELGIKAGETTPDGLFTIRKVECLASCATAPMLQCGQKYYEQLTEKDVSALIETLRREAGASPGGQS
jgi:NADH-quinone oxidoreductase subunit E